MRNKTYLTAIGRIAAGLAAALFVLTTGTVHACANVQKTNPDTGYELLIDDAAGFLSDHEEASLEDLMEKITEYGNIAIVTTTDHDCNSTKYFAGTYFEDYFAPHVNGTLFVIDRCLNEIYLYNDGSARKTITDSKAYSITDNTYIYATSRYDYDYYSCCYKTMEQVLALRRGQRIAEPMKYICSALLALIVALLANYLLAMRLSQAKRPDVRELLDGTYVNVNVKNPTAVFLRETRTYSPQSSGGGGGGHSSGGGGGHSGGGGGHKI